MGLAGNTNTSSFSDKKPNNKSPTTIDTQRTPIKQPDGPTTTRRWKQSINTAITIRNYLFEIFIRRLRQCVAIVVAFLLSCPRQCLRRQNALSLFFSFSFSLTLAHVRASNVHRVDHPVRLIKQIINVLDSIHVRQRLEMDCSSFSPVFYTNSQAIRLHTGVYTIVCTSEECGRGLRL